jgi:hypothetical protein
MSNPLQKHLQNGFADFDGLRISGTIPLREDLVNQLIADVLQSGLPTPSATPEAKIDPNPLLQRVKSARVRFEAGRAVLDFEVGV